MGNLEERVKKKEIRNGFSAENPKDGINVIHIYGQILPTVYLANLGETTDIAHDSKNPLFYRKVGKNNGNRMVQVVEFAPHIFSKDADITDLDAYYNLGALGELYHALDGVKQLELINKDGKCVACLYR